MNGLHAHRSVSQSNNEFASIGTPSEGKNAFEET